jgi:hypothetical protein
LLSEALKDDYTGKEAIRLFIQNHPAMLTRSFEDMVAATTLMQLNQLTQLPPSMNWEWLS